MTRKVTPPKPFVDVLFEKPEGFEMMVRLRHSMRRVDDKIILKTMYSAVSGQQYTGELVFEQSMMEKKSPIIKPGG